jgi:transcriptional regulator with GAF, ATPase, and Fis domain
MASPLTQAVRSENRLPIDVFIVSPNPRLRQQLRERLGLPLWNVIEAGSGARALELLNQAGGADGILLLDPMLPDLEPTEFQGMVGNRFPATQVLTMNSQTGQLLLGSCSPTPLSTRLVNEINQVRTIGTGPTLYAVNDGEARHDVVEGIKLRGMIGNSEPMLRTYSMTRMVALRDTTVLVTGESGTGKDLIAQEIHMISPRRKHPFVVVNCSAIPETLLEAELFGYAKGSFTGAAQSRIGRIHFAHGGTLFLDEIGDMPLSLQSKILRFLEQGEVQRLGGNDVLKVDVRVVAATNVDLKKLISQQLFREDLYYRLAVFPIHLPPLRDRMGDLEELARAFAVRYAPGALLTQEALQVLARHTWPGNVRELRNVIERAAILLGTEQDIKPEHIFI